MGSCLSNSKKRTKKKLDFTKQEGDPEAKRKNCHLIQINPSSFQSLVALKNVSIREPALLDPKKNPLFVSRLATAGSLTVPV